MQGCKLSEAIITESLSCASPIIIYGPHPPTKPFVCGMKEVTVSKCWKATPALYLVLCHAESVSSSSIVLHSSTFLILLLLISYVWSHSWDKSLMAWDTNELAHITEIKAAHRDAVMALAIIEETDGNLEVWTGAEDG